MPGKHKSEEIRKIIVGAKQRGKNYKDIAEQFHVGQATVFRIWKLWEETKNVKHRKIPGRPRKTTPRQDRLLVRQVKVDPFMTAVDVRKYASDNLGVNILDRTEEEF